MIVFAFLKRRPLVSICVPAYQSEKTIRETLQSALEQTVEDIEIVVSNDGGHPTPSLEHFGDNPKVRIYQSATRRGWVENSNFVLSRARGKFFMILPHDDMIRPQYIELCVGILEGNKDIFAAYSDIECKNGLMEATEVTGPLEQRITNIMRNRYNGYSYRAVMPRRSADWPMLKLKPNPPSDFCVDTTWILQQACLGELRKVAGPLYWKGYHAANTHSGWRNLSPTELRTAWQAHCHQMGKIAADRLGESENIGKLVTHRLDARRVLEAPGYLKAAMDRH